MRDVKLVSLSEDGSHLVLTHESTGEQFALTIDDRVRAAVVSDRARLGQLPLDVESRLRPKEIQTRIRAGESSEDIAAAAGVSVERVLRYAGPVLAEREHVAMQAQRCAVSRHGHEGPGAILQQMVESRLGAAGVTMDTLAWDAWRTDAGRWTVAASYLRNGEEQTATFEFDPVARIVIPNNDRSRLLTGDSPDPTSASSASSATNPTGRPSTEAGSRSWLAAVPDSTSDIGPSDISPSHTAPQDYEDTLDLSGVQAGLEASANPAGRPSSPPKGTPPTSGEAAGRAGQEPVAPADSNLVDSGLVASTDEAALPDTAAPSESDGVRSTQQPATQQPAAQQQGGRSRRRSKRAVVPSWDEILFGAGDNDPAD